MQNSYVAQNNQSQYNQNTNQINQLKRNMSKQLTFDGRSDHLNKRPSY